MSCAESSATTSGSSFLTSACTLGAPKISKSASAAATGPIWRRTSHTGFKSAPHRGCGGGRGCCRQMRPSADGWAERAKDTHLMIGWPNDEGLPKVKEGRRPRLGARTHAGQLTRNTGLFIHVTRNTDSVHHLPSTIDAILVLLLPFAHSARIRIVVKGREKEWLCCMLALRLYMRRRRLSDMRSVKRNGPAAVLVSRLCFWRSAPGGALTPTTPKIQKAASSAENYNVGQEVQQQQQKILI